MSIEKKFDQKLPEWSKDLEEHWLKTLPLFVSIPRSGCNWLQAVMELYFNRHRAGKAETNPSWLESEWENPMWMHTHDNFNNPGQGKIQTNKPAIFLWRDPTDVVYSFMKLQNIPLENVYMIQRLCSNFVELYKKWAMDSKNVLVIKYEDVLKDPSNEMKKISEWHGIKFDEERSQWAFKIVGNKKRTNEKNGHAPHFKNTESHTREYKNGREIFRKQWKEKIDQFANKLLEEI